MDAASWVDLQEALIWFYGPFVQPLLVILVAGGLLSAISVVVMDSASRIAR